MKTLFSILVLLAVMFGLAAAARGGDTKTLYTCGMHPQIIQAHPGNCPICGMKLTPIRKSAGPEADANNSSAIPLDATMTQNMNLRLRKSYAVPCAKPSGQLAPLITMRRRSPT